MHMALPEKMERRPGSFTCRGRRPSQKGLAFMVSSTAAAGNEKDARMNPTTANLARIDAWITALADEVDAAAHSAEMTRVLEMMSRFWTYSTRNCWLISSQMPEASR